MMAIRNIGLGQSGKYPFTDPPQTDKDGHLNHIKMAANALDRGDVQEAGYLLADIIDTLSTDRVRFHYDGGPDKPAAKPKRGRDQVAAAAPELLAACERMLRAHDEHWKVAAMDFPPIDDIRAAVAKAKGGGK